MKMDMVKMHYSAEDITSLLHNETYLQSVDIMTCGLTLFTVFSSVLWFTFALVVTHCVYTRPSVLTRFGLALVYISKSKIHQS